MDGMAYCSAGMFPSEGVYLTALDVSDGSRKWQQAQFDLPAQGYILTSATRLYVPAGRNNPVVYDRIDGTRIRVVSGQGGTYCLLTDNALVFGPGKTGTLGMVEQGSSDQLASFSGNHMIVTPAMSFLHSDTDITALDRTRYLELSGERRKVSQLQSQAYKQLRKLEEDGGEAAADTIALIRKDLINFGRQIDELSDQMQQCQPWKVECRYPASLILAGDYLLAGGENGFAAYSRTDGSRAFEATVEGTVYGMSAGNGRLFVSTDQGFIYCFNSATLVGAARNPGSRP
jgi:outer membrane protein assembly factor BamB